MTLMDFWCVLPSYDPASFTENTSLYAGEQEAVIAADAANARADEGCLHWKALNAGEACLERYLRDTGDSPE